MPIFVNVMSKKEKASEFIEKAAQILDCILLGAFTLLAVGVLMKTFRLETRSLARIRFHYPLFVGFGAFFVTLVFPHLRRNIRWLMNFTHEFIHLVFALVFFRKIHRFNVDDSDCHVSFSSGPLGYMPITLSPYCFPLFTLILLPWRFTTPETNEYYLMVIDFLIGFSYAFHVCCWVTQTRLHQTDITGPGTVRSLLYITFFVILGFCIVLLTPSSGVQLAVTRVLWDFPKGIITSLLSIF